MFWRNVAVFTASMVLLCSCLDQHDPANNQPLSPAFQGEVQMIDTYQGGQPAGAAIAALFESVTPSASVSRFMRRGMRRLGATAQGPICHFSTDNVAQAAADAPTIYNAGELSYEVDGAPDSDLVQVPFDKTLQQYARGLAAGFGSGKYRILASGSANVPAFSEILYMPELPSVVEANGQSFSGAVQIQQSVPLLLEWNELSSPIAYVADSVDIEVQLSKTQVQTLHCEVYESDLQTSKGAAVWSIDTTELAQLAPNLPAAITFTREADVLSQQAALQKLWFVGARVVSAASATVVP